MSVDRSDAYQNLLKQLDNDPLSIESIPIKDRNDELCRLVLSKNWRTLKFIPEEKFQYLQNEIQHALNSCMKNIGYNFDDLSCIPEVLINDELKQAFISKNESLISWYDLENIPVKFITHDLCTKLIKQDAKAFQFVPVALRNHELCLEAVKKQPGIIKFIENPDQRSALTIKEYESICLAALNRNSSVVNMIDKKARADIQLTHNALLNIRNDWKYIAKVPTRLLTYELCLAAIGINQNPLPVIRNPDARPNLNKNEYENICLKVISINPAALNDVDAAILNKDFYKKILKLNPYIFKLIQNPELSLADHKELYQFYKEQHFIMLLNEARKTMKFDEIIEYLNKNNQSPEVINFINRNVDYKPESVIDNLLIENKFEDLKKHSQLIKNYDALHKKFANFEILIMLVEGIAHLNPDQQSNLFSLMAEKENVSQQLNSLKIFFKDEGSNEIDKIKKMIAEKNPEVFLLMSLLMPYTKSFGSLDHNHALLTCAEVSARKPYEFNPTVITSNQQDEYFEILKNSEHTEIRERFCITAGHWRTGDIQIKNDRVNIVILDSFGLPEEDKYYTKLMLDEVSKTFSNSAAVFFDKTTRQYSGFGCSVVSLDDLMHLFTLENYLPQKDLFLYFASQGRTSESISLNTDTNINIIPSDLPLSLMRITQDEKLKTKIIPSRKEEESWSVNKNKQTALESVAPSFVSYNFRLKDKLHKMAGRALTYLTSHGMSQVIMGMQKHTLDGFKQRINSQENLYKNQALPASKPRQ